jgi:tetratricopeptide (TPR) repeat protein
VTILLGGSAWFIFRPRPNLIRAVALAEAGRLDEAVDHLRSFVRANPRSNPAHLLMAQIHLRRAERQATASQRPDPKAALVALAHLRRIRPEDPKLAALVQLNQGKADYYLARFDEAEASWNTALRQDPTVPEAGWCLLELYYLQGRIEEARQLAMRQFEVEPDRRDQVQLLMELVRQDAQPPAPASVVQWFQRMVRQNPRDLHANLALGLGLVHDDKTEEGLRILQTLVERHPANREAWDAWLTGLDDTSRVDGQALPWLARAVDRLPPALAASPQFARFKGRVAQERGDWKGAVRAYRRAQEVAPHDQRLEYHLIRALRQIGATQEAERKEHEYHTRITAGQEVRNLHMRANAVKTLGTQPHPALYQEIADLRERMGLIEESRAWHRLVLRDDPQNARSQLALKRLRDSGKPPGFPEARARPAAEKKGHPRDAQGARLNQPGIGAARDRGLHVLDDDLA